MLTSDARVTQTRWINAPTLAISASFLRLPRLRLAAAVRGLAPSSIPSLCATVLGLLAPFIPAGPLARGCFECVGPCLQLPARAIREAAASTLLLGLSSAQISGPISVPFSGPPGTSSSVAHGRHLRAQRSLAFASAASGLTRALQLVRASGAGMQPVRYLYM